MEHWEIEDQFWIIFIQQRIQQNWYIQQNCRLNHNPIEVRCNTTCYDKTTIFYWLFQLDDSKSLHKKWLFRVLGRYSWSDYWCFPVHPSGSNWGFKLRFNFQQCHGTFRQQGIVGCTTTNIPRHGKSTYKLYFCGYLWVIIPKNLWRTQKISDKLPSGTPT